MSLSNVKLILGREIRDQLRDRRTLFVIAVLPILLYPLLGMSLLQISQFTREQVTRVLVVGRVEAGDLPPLVEKRQFAAKLFADPDRAKLLELQFASDKPQSGEKKATDPRDDARRQVLEGRYEAAIVFPDDFAQRLAAFRAAMRDRTENRAAEPKKTEKNVLSDVPSPEIVFNAASEKSQLARSRLADVLRRWTDQIAADNLVQSGVPTLAARPFIVETADVADAGRRNGSMWSKILPVLLLVWALTGAFYPAIDLCAGEKERGTLETLLCSPAGRGEIVVGKLATVMLFSVVTAVLNLASIGLTGLMIVAPLPGFGLPPPTAIAALAVALLPISALFSALCLALAAFARSTKEGQYYLMPLLMATMPLVVLPMAPGVELNLGTSLIPISGMVLLLRGILEGNYWQVAQYLPIVAAVTLGACVLSIRWAIEQFNSESVLFQAGERLDVRLWLRRLLRDRQPTPSVAAAATCSVLILLANFYLSMSQTMPEGFGGFLRTVLSTQFMVIALPALLMTLLLTRSPRETLLLRRPPRFAIAAAALLAVVLHPVANILQVAVRQLYPISDSVLPAFEKMSAMLRQADFWPLVLVIALVPAVCEELAFRGFILSGFRHLGHKWRAIFYSAILFGITHGILQQSLIACLMGAVLGYLAVQSGSILPGIVFHAINNALAVANSRIDAVWIPNAPLIRKLVSPAEGGGCMFEWPAVAIGLLSAILLLLWFGRLSAPKSDEEAMEEAIRRGPRQQPLLTPEQPACT